MTQRDPDPRLTHLDAAGRARMVDISDKAVTTRRAIVEARVKINADLAEAIRTHAVAKGDVFEVARIAGVMGAKQTENLIPLCHGLPLDHVDITLRLGDACIYIQAIAKTAAKTGVEMEAYTAATVAALTVIDMGKAVDPAMVIEHVRLVEKTGGRRGTLRPHPSEMPETPSE